MNQHTFTVLEFQRIRAFLADHAVSAGGKRCCLELVPANDLAAAQALQAETVEMYAEIEDHGPLALGGIHDLRPLLTQTRVPNSYLDPEALLQVQDTLETADALHARLAGHHDLRPQLAALAGAIASCPDLQARIRRCIARDGTLHDHASKERTRLRSDLERLRRSIMRKLEEHFTDRDLSAAVRDDFITQRNERYVIPVRTDSKSAIPGVVHDESNTGGTFFVEPMAVVTLNNDLQLIRKQEQAEQIRILRDLTRAIARDEPVIATTVDILETIDCIHARALLARAYQGTPPIIHTGTQLDLRQARHPILLAHRVADEEEQNARWLFDRPEVVAIDLRKQARVSTLIITGANAGGKTVAMKTLGLFVLMAQAGLHLPVASGSRLPLFASVFADIGDEQNIEASLSTFSAHMAQIKECVTRATVSTLVLLDELGSGTDPDEGGPLAVAIIDHLRQRNCCTVVTSHLNILKTYAYRTDDVTNVSVGVDPETQQPTYQLVYGVPGISHALAIARRLGLPDTILDAARQLHDPAEKQAAVLIAGLERERRKMDRVARDHRSLRRTARTLEQTMRQLLQAMQQRRHDCLKDFELQTRRMLRDCEDELKQLIKTQRKTTRTTQTETGPLQQLDQLRQQVRSHYPPPAAGQHIPPDTLADGQRVRIVPLGKTGTVAAADDKLQRAEISVGAVTIKTAYAELQLLGPPPRSQARTAPRQAVPSAAPAAGTRQVNLIGTRVPDALDRVDKEIDTCLLQHAAQLQIIHGRGTGRLMRAIREHLANHPQIARFEPGDQAHGGDGITIAHLAE